MLRSRKRHSAASPNATSERKEHREGFSASRKQDPLIPTPVLIGIILFFIFLGFATEHYKKSRSLDPFNGRSLGKNKILLQKEFENARLGVSQLTIEEDERLEFQDGQRYHLIFSTDCSPYQHWQR